MPDVPTRSIDPAILALDARDRERVARLVLGLRTRGVSDMAVLGAIEQIPRKLFVMAEDRDCALADRPKVIECGQTAMAPSVVGRCLQALRLAPGQRILDVGTGSGYTAAVMARIAGKVFTLDRYQTLVELAAERFAALRLDNVVAAVGDGLQGWRDHAPFDRIFVAGAVAEIPSLLVEQLRPEGILLAPVGAAGEWQQLVRVTRADRGVETETVMDVRFTALTPGRAATL